MASDKEQMMSSANYYAGLVASAKNACTRAKDSIASTQNIIQEGWHGEAGSAMTQAMNEVQSELVRISARLESLESQMRDHTMNIYNSWIENDEETK